MILLFLKNNFYIFKKNKQKLSLFSNYYDYKKLIKLNKFLFFKNHLLVFYKKSEFVFNKKTSLSHKIFFKKFIINFNFKLFLKNLKIFKSLKNLKSFKTLKLNKSLVNKNYKFINNTFIYDNNILLKLNKRFYEYSNINGDLKLEKKKNYTNNIKKKRLKKVLVSIVKKIRKLLKLKLNLFKFINLNKFNFNLRNRLQNVFDQNLKTNLFELKMKTKKEILEFYKNFNNFLIKNKLNYKDNNGINIIKKFVFKLNFHQFSKKKKNKIFNKNLLRIHKEILFFLNHINFFNFNNLINNYNLLVLFDFNKIEQNNNDNLLLYSFNLDSNNNYIYNNSVDNLSNFFNLNNNNLLLFKLKKKNFL